MKSHVVPRTLYLISLVALTGALFGQSSFASNPKSSPSFANRERILPTSSNHVLGDFDGDRRLDEADLHVAGEHRCIRVRYGNSREDHLDFRDTVQGCGTLLIRDINHDNNPDLIWISWARWVTPAVWLGDEHGHFFSAADVGIDDQRGVFLGDFDLAQSSNEAEEQTCVTPDPVSSEPARTAILDNEFSGVLGDTHRNHLGEPAPYLSYLRERGPPRSSF